MDHVDGRTQPPQLVEILTERFPVQVRCEADAAHPALHEAVLIGTDRRLRERAHADDFGRHALADLRLGGRAREVEEVGMRVHVDEARRDDAAGDVDHPIGGAAELRGDRGNVLAVHRDVRRAARRAGPIDHRAAAQQQRPGHAIPRRR
jgi:hypothetical protein